MRLVVISFKECWPGPDQRWYTDGGFSAQMAALSSLFDEMWLVITEGPPRAGGNLLPVGARVIALRKPVGSDTRRKIDILLHLPYYLGNIVHHLRHADVVHTPLPGDIPLLAFVAAQVLRKPLIARFAGSWNNLEITSPVSRFTKYLMRRFAGGRNVMLATGLSAVSPHPNVHWIFSSSITQKEAKNIQPNLDRAANSPLRYIYLGRLSTEKGLVSLINAWSLVKQRPAMRDTMPMLTLVGEGPQRPLLEEQAHRLGCKDHVTFAGLKSRQDVLLLLQQADVCVLPSLTEGFPKVRIEAMLCGTPVITTDVGYGREIVGADGERGWIIPVEDPAALAARVHALCDEPPEWPALRRRCRAFAETFTLEDWVEQIGTLCAQQWGIALVDGKLR